MKLYDSSGRPLKRKSDTAYYYSKDILTPVPTMLDGKESILQFVLTCIRETYPDITIEELNQVWEASMENMEKIISSLKTIRDSEKAWYKINAYNRAIQTLSRLEFPIVSGKQARKLRGIGKGIGDKIDEILATGKLQRIEKMKTPIIEKEAKRKVLDLFKSIQGVGPVRAEQWYKAGYRTLDDIRAHEWTSLSKPAKLTIKFHKELAQPISRASIEYEKEFLEAPLYLLDPKAKFELVGSYRRGRPFSNDVDILISSQHGRSLLDEYIDSLIVEGNVIYILQKKKEKITTLAQMVKGPKIVKMDFFFSSWESWGVGLLAWTGPGEFEKTLRIQAKRKGLKLSATTLEDRKTGKVIPTPTEKSVFKALGMEYIPPEKRY